MRFGAEADRKVQSGVCLCRRSAVYGDWTRRCNCSNPPWILCTITLAATYLLFLGHYPIRAPNPCRHTEVYVNITGTSYSLAYQLHENAEKVVRQKISYTSSWNNISVESRNFYRHLVECTHLFRSRSGNMSKKKKNSNTHHATRIKHVSTSSTHLKTTANGNVWRFYIQNELSLGT